MFILNSENQIENGLEKARKAKPKIKTITFGKYLVQGSKGNFYEVYCKRNPLGQKQVDCECKGGQKDLVCYHAVSALGLHICLAEQKQMILA